eukprot:1032027-Pleurochrysis_carterae.AAC.1
MAVSPNCACKRTRPPSVAHARACFGKQANQARGQQHRLVGARCGPMYSCSLELAIIQHLYESLLQI